MADPLIRVNQDVAGRLDEAAALLREQGANPFRVRAYARAAETIRGLDEPVSEILAARGVEGLESLSGIGQSLARNISDIVHLGYFPMLARLRGEADPLERLRLVPGIGRTLAARLHDELGIETLEDLEAAGVPLGRTRREHPHAISDVGLQELFEVRLRTSVTRLPPPSFGDGALDVELDLPRRREVGALATPGRTVRVSPADPVPSAALFDCRHR